MLNTGENNITSARIDPGGGYAYFSAGVSSSVIIKVDLATFTRVESLTLNTGENSVFTGVIDPANCYAYHGTAEGASTGKIIKVRLSDFTHVGCCGSNTRHPVRARLWWTRPEPSRILAWRRRWAPTARRWSR